jgi:hypothetical protein
MMTIELLNMSIELGAPLALHKQLSNLFAALWILVHLADLPLLGRRCAVWICFLSAGMFGSKGISREVTLVLRDSIRGLSVPDFTLFGG